MFDKHLTLIMVNLWALVLVVTRQSRVLAHFGHDANQFVHFGDELVRVDTRVERFKKWVEMNVNC